MSLIVISIAEMILKKQIINHVTDGLKQEEVEKIKSERFGFLQCAHMVAVRIQEDSQTIYKWYQHTSILDAPNKFVVLKKDNVYRYGRTNLGNFLDLTVFCNGNVKLEPNNPDEIQDHVLEPGEGDDIVLKKPIVHRSFKFSTGDGVLFREINLIWAWNQLMWEFKFQRASVYHKWNERYNFSRLLDKIERPCYSLLLDSFFYDISIAFNQETSIGRFEFTRRSNFRELFYNGLRIEFLYWPGVYNFFLQSV